MHLWDAVLALPLIGTLDSSRTQVVMQNLLEAIVTTRSDFRDHRYHWRPSGGYIGPRASLGAECMISGIRPQIAQAIIHLGVDLTGVVTKATLADAFAIALGRIGYTVVRDQKKIAVER